MSAKILELEGCKNTKCKAWLDDCKRAVVYRVGRKLNIKMIKESHEVMNLCELFLHRRFKDERKSDTE